MKWVNLHAQIEIISRWGKTPLLSTLFFFLDEAAHGVNATKIAWKVYSERDLYRFFPHLLARIFVLLLPFPLFLLVKYLIFQWFNSLFMHCRVGSSCKYLNEMRKKLSKLYTPIVCFCSVHISIVCPQKRLLLVNNLSILYEQVNKLLNMLPFSKGNEIFHSFLIFFWRVCALELVPPESLSLKMTYIHF